MAKGINKVILIGNIGADPVCRVTPTNNSTIANFSLSTSESWKDKQTGEKKEVTEWHKIVFFGRQAEIIQEFCKKGTKLYIEGSLKTRKWTDKNGVDRYTTEIIGSDLTFLGANPVGNHTDPAPKNESIEDELPF